MQTVVYNDGMSTITVIAHNIRSAYNVGSIFRICDGFGVAKLILSGYTPYPRVKNDSRLPHIADGAHRQIVKTALGAENHVEFEYVADLKSWIEKTSLPIVGLEQHPSSYPLPSYIPPKNFALLLGEEVNGIDTNLFEDCSAFIEIPMLGKKESFNVSVACGIALYGLRLNDHTLPTNHSNQLVEK